MIPFLIVLAHMAGAPACAVTGAAPESDVARAHAACVVARSRFTELFGSDAPELLIVLKPEPGYRVAHAGTRAIVLWPIGEADLPPGLDAARAARLLDSRWRDVLPHESMHALLLARYFADGSATPHDGYGTPLPDWFEEAVAIWAEPHESRDSRLNRARALPAPQRDLHTILTTPHPAAARPDLLGARDGAPLPADDAALWAFYPQALAVLAFVYDGGGDAAVRELLRRLLRGPSDLQALAGLPGHATRTDDLVRAWHRWLSRTGTRSAGRQAETALAPIPESRAG